MFEICTALGYAFGMIDPAKNAEKKFLNAHREEIIGLFNGRSASHITQEVLSVADLSNREFELLSLDSVTLKVRVLTVVSIILLVVLPLIFATPYPIVSMVCAGMGGILLAASWYRYLPKINYLWQIEAQITISRIKAYIISQSKYGEGILSPEVDKAFDELILKGSPETREAYGTYVFEKLSRVKNPIRNESVNKYLKLYLETFESVNTFTEEEKACYEVLKKAPPDVKNRYRDAYLKFASQRPKSKYPQRPPVLAAYQAAMHSSA